MKKINPKGFIKSVPNVQSVTLPDDWFDNINTKHSVFGYLYQWMLENKRVPPDLQNDIVFRTYAGEKIYKKLVAAEEKRLKHIYKYKGEDLERALSWNCMQSAPMNKIAGLDISGDHIFVIPGESISEMENYRQRIEEELRDQKIKKIRDQAAGANFRDWLVSQIERPDRIGDLAQDVEGDLEFPVNVDNYEELEQYLKFKCWDSAFIECLRAAWFEYMEQYPERIIPCAYCSNCGDLIDLNEALLCINKYEVYVIHSTCQDQLENLYDFEKNFYLKEIEYSLDKIEEFIDQIKHKNIASFFKHEWDDIHEKLQLWGILPIERQGTVYFIQSELKDSIKIGYTSGNPEVRRKSLQTGHSHKLKVIATLPGKPEYEKELHKRFAKYRLHGEWFECHPDILAFISTLK